MPWRQGLLIKRQPEVTEMYAQMVADKVITLQNIGNELMTGAAQRPHHAAARGLAAPGRRPGGRAGAGGRPAGDRHHASTTRSAPRWPPRRAGFAPIAFNDAEFSRRQSGKIYKYIADQMRRMGPDDFVEMLRSAIKQDEWLLFVHGGALGFVRRTAPPGDLRSVMDEEPVAPPSAVQATCRPARHRAGARRRRTPVAPTTAVTVRRRCCPTALRPRRPRGAGRVPCRSCGRRRTSRGWRRRRRATCSSWSVSATVAGANYVAQRAIDGEAPTAILQDAAGDLRSVRAGARSACAPTSPRELAAGRPLPERVAPRPQTPQDLQRRGTDLLRRSNDVHVIEDTHPAFARILTEITPDEARILRFLYLDGPQPAIDVRTWRPVRHRVHAHRGRAEHGRRARRLPQRRSDHPVPDEPVPARPASNFSKEQVEQPAALPGDRGAAQGDAGDEAGRPDAAHDPPQHPADRVRRRVRAHLPAAQPAPGVRPGDRRGRGRCGGRHCQGGHCEGGHGQGRNCEALELRRLELPRPA